MSSHVFRLDVIDCQLKHTVDCCTHLIPFFHPSHLAYFDYVKHGVLAALTSPEHSALCLNIALHAQIHGDSQDTHMHRCRAGVF